MPTDLKLTVSERMLFDLFDRHGEDVPIDVLYVGMSGPPDRADETTYPQKWLGGYITRLNRRLAAVNMKIEPGALKRTYRLVSTTQ